MENCEICLFVYPFWGGLRLHDLATGSYNQSFVKDIRNLAITIGTYAKTHKPDVRRDLEDVQKAVGRCPSLRYLQLCFDPAGWRWPKAIEYQEWEDRFDLTEQFLKQVVTRMRGLKVGERVLTIPEGLRS